MVAESSQDLAAAEHDSSAADAVSEPPDGPALVPGNRGRRAKRKAAGEITGVAETTHAPGKPRRGPLLLSEFDKPWEWVPGYFHSFESGGTVDGPGIRFVMFLTGCPLRCQYCHNPDTWHLKEGKPTTAGAMVAEVRDCIRYIRRRGGVTLSGGDPLAQPLFTTALLHGVKQLKIHTALDTSGYLGHLATDEMLDLTDLVLLDIKSWNPETYRRVTGVDLAPTLTFAERLNRMGKPMWVRFVLVPGLTDDPANAEGLAGFLAGLSNVSRIEVLPFHQMGANKWESLGLRYPLADAEPPSQEVVEQTRAIFRDTVPGAEVT